MYFLALTVYLVTSFDFLWIVSFNLKQWQFYFFYNLDYFYFYFLTDCLGEGLRYYVK